MNASLRPLVVLVLSLGVAGATFAQHQHQSGYTGMESRDIKALSSEQIADLREGRGMGASLPAELNGFPGPMHVLQLKDQLSVTAEQQAALERITVEMKASAQRLGQQVIAAEGALDQVFRAGAPDEAAVRDATSRIASLNAELRAVHLVAHLRTRRLLSDPQVMAYNQARGYAAPASNDHKH
jgi:Spy/CpxP family protein refolding chaperone